MSERRERKDDVPRLEPPLQAILLDEIAITVRNLTEVMQATIPRGESPSFLRDITNELVDIKQPYPSPWFSFFLHNYGPQPVFLGVNKKPELDPKYGDEVKVGETREMDMRTAKIEQIYLQCDIGGQATVRVRGVF